jgi:hypothetical protein
LFFLFHFVDGFAQVQTLQNISAVGSQVTFGHVVNQQSSQTPLFLVEVLFIEKDDPQGHLIQLEAGGRFYHLALRVPDAPVETPWIHTHPWRGSELAGDRVIRQMGHRFFLAQIEWPFPVTLQLVGSWLGRPFDRQFLWDDENLYCSELVAKILGLEPQPMVFDPALWPEEFLKFNGEPGISPDEVYRRLQRGIKRMIRLLL